MESKVSAKGQEKLRSNLQIAHSAHSILLARGVKDYDVHANGVNTTLDDALVGDLDPANPLNIERPHHRRFLDMTIQGYIPQEIADQTGFSRQTVQNTLRQPWARKYLIEQSKKTVMDEMKEFLEAEVLPSLKALKAVRDGQDVRNADRIVASTALLDRFLGKPVQPMTGSVKPPVEMSDEELREQVAREITADQPNWTHFHQLSKSSYEDKKFVGAFLRGVGTVDTSQRNIIS